jgi:hypothetical protein
MKKVVETESPMSAFLVSCLFAKPIKISDNYLVNYPIRIAYPII